MFSKSNKILGKAFIACLSSSTFLKRKLFHIFFIILGCSINNSNILAYFSLKFYIIFKNWKWFFHILVSDYRKSFIHKFFWFTQNQPKVWDQNKFREGGGMLCMFPSTLNIEWCMYLMSKNINFTHNPIKSN